MNESIYKNISYAEAMNIIEKASSVIIDVRTKEEYDKWHIKNSINIPVNEVSDIAKGVLKDKEKMIFVYCSAGIRSVVACEILAGLGYENVYNIEKINEGL